MEALSNQAEPRRVRSLFVSDLHLGSPFAKAEEFLSFLENYHPDYLYIVGDFIDGWSLQRSWRWTAHYNRILQHLFAWAVDGVRIRYTPGNHDAFLRGFLQDFGWVEVADEFVHRGADRRRYLVTHGDRFDDVEARRRGSPRSDPSGTTCCCARTGPSIGCASKWVSRPGG